jgi:polar amino acid transport system substrate-binding protein
MKRIFFIVTTLIFIAVTGCNRTGEQVQSGKSAETLYQKILRTGQIRVGYVSYASSYIINPDGTHTGIFHDVMEEIAKNMGIEIKYAKEVTWDGMIQDIQDGKIDMVVTGIWPTTQRGKHVDFLEPLFYSPVKAYTYHGNQIFDNNIDRVNAKDVKISTIDGEMSQIIAIADFPQAKQVTVSQMTGVPQVLLDMKEKKADITFVEPIVALEFLSKNPESIQEVKGVQALRVFPNCMMVPKNQEDLKSTLNIALHELINNGFVDRIISKYEKYPNSYYRTQLPYREK